MISSRRNRCTVDSRILDRRSALAAMLISSAAGGTGPQHSSLNGEPLSRLGTLNDALVLMPRNVGSWRRQSEGKGDATRGLHGVGREPRRLSELEVNLETLRRSADYKRKRLDYIVKWLI